jgi:NDP-sugar pyrophosphorylase family protein
LIECAVILALGAHTPQSQLTFNRTHTMLPVLGKPLVVRAMERLYRAGVQNYIVVIGESEGAVAAYINNQWLPNVNITFVIQPSHTSLSRTLAEVARRQSKPFIVSGYNTLLHSNFVKRLVEGHAEDYKGLTIAAGHSSLSKIAAQSYLRKNDKVVTEMVSASMSDHSTPAMAELAVCGTHFLEFLDHRSRATGGLSRDLRDVFAAYLKTGAPAQAAETAWFLQVEADYDLLTANRLLLEEVVDTHILSEMPVSVQITTPVRIDPQVSIGQGAVIGPRTYLESGCSIGHHAVVRNAVILQGAVIPARTTVSDCIVTSRTQIYDPNRSQPS